MPAWTLADPCREAEERWNKSFHPASMSRVVHRLGFSRQKARQVRPQSDHAAQAAFAKRGCRPRSTRSRVLIRIGGSPSGSRTKPEIGQKGRICHRWWPKGQRPPGLRDRRFEWAYLFAALCPATGESSALVLPVLSTKAMSVFLDHFAAKLAPDEHAVMVPDQAGWHGARALRTPENVFLVPLPPYATELNPIECVWLFLRQRFLSHRLLGGYYAIIDAFCSAWNRLTPERLRSLCN